MGCVKFQIHGEDRDFLKKSDHIWDAKKIHEQKKSSSVFFYVPQYILTRGVFYPS